MKNYPWFIGMFLCLIYLGTFLVPSARAQLTLPSKIEGHYIAIFPLQPSGQQAQNSKWISTALQTSLTEDFSQLQKVETLQKGTVNQRLSETGLKGLNPNSGRNAIRMGKALEADLLLIGTYQLSGDSISISAIFYDHQQQTIIGEQQTVKGAVSNIAYLQKKLLTNLLRTADYRLPNERWNTIAQDHSMSFEEFKKEFAPTEPLSQLTEQESPAQDDSPETTKSTEKEQEQSIPASNNYSVGVIYPGVSFGAQTPRIGGEIRLASSGDISILSGRVSHHFYYLSKTSNLYWGGQLGTVNFEGDISEGSGLVFGTYGGYRKFFTNSFAFTLDIGAFPTVLEDDETGVDDTAVNFGINTSINYHFF